MVVAASAGEGARQRPRGQPRGRGVLPARHAPRRRKRLPPRRGARGRGAARPRGRLPRHPASRRSPRVASPERPDGAVRAPPGGPLCDDGHAAPGGVRARGGRRRRWCRRRRVPDEVVEAVLAGDVLVGDVLAGSTLGQDQAEAVRGLLTGGEQVALLVAPVGAGKSRALEAARRGWAGAGHGADRRPGPSRRSGERGQANARPRRRSPPGRRRRPWWALPDPRGRPRGLRARDGPAIRARLGDAASLRLRSRDPSILSTYLANDRIQRAVAPP